MTSRSHGRICLKCGRKERPLDTEGYCSNCHGRAGRGPDLTCANLGRGDLVPRAPGKIIGIDHKGKSFGCCSVCHGNYFACEVQLKDGRYVEACCTVTHALEKKGLLLHSPSDWACHVPDAMKRDQEES